MAKPKSYPGVFIDLTAWQIYEDDFESESPEIMADAWPVEDGKPTLLFGYENGQPCGAGSYEHRGKQWGLLHPNHERIKQWLTREQYTGAVDFGSLDNAGMLTEMPSAPTTPLELYVDINGGYLERLRPVDLTRDQALKDIALRYMLGAIALAIAGFFILLGGQ